MSLDDRIDQACAAVGAAANKMNTKSAPSVPESGFHVELREAMWLAWDDGLTLQEVVGEVRRMAISVARERADSAATGRKRFGISHTTFYRIENNGNKY
jgi:hypothetical protein